MSTTTMKYFDPINYAQQLCNAGFSRKQSDIQAQAIKSVMTKINTVAEIHNFVTKNDLALTETKLSTTDQEIRLIKWVISSGSATILALAGLIKYMH